VTRASVRSSTVQRSGAKRAGRSQRGYVLLTLLLIVSLTVIATALAASSIAFEIRRDREEEMIHRGVQYSRAIRSYAKKTGHYPMDIHELFDPHGVKYLRKLYKDPITGKDFRFLHTADIMSKTDLNASLHNTMGSDNALSDRGLSADANSGTTPDASNNTTANPNPQAQAGKNANSSGGSVFGVSDSANALPGDNPMGGVIIGVASVSKKKSIREFDHKNRYDQWLFFYDPNYDRGYPIKGPTSMSLSAASAGAPAGSIGQPAGGFGQSPAFGQSPGSFGQAGSGSGSGLSSGGFNSAQPAPSSSPQQ
jgi:type II secretory pathway pseudopilin PulG